MKENLRTDQAVAIYDSYHNVRIIINHHFHIDPQLSFVTFFVVMLQNKTNTYAA